MIDPEKDCVGQTMDDVKLSVVVFVRLVELDFTHTGLNLNGVLCEVLHHCGLIIKTVYSCATDNRANMMKAFHTTSCGNFCQYTYSNEC